MSQMIIESQPTYLVLHLLTLSYLSCYPVKANDIALRVKLGVVAYFPPYPAAIFTAMPSFECHIGSRHSSVLSITPLQGSVFNCGNSFFVKYFKHVMPDDFISSIATLFFIRRTDIGKTIVMIQLPDNINDIFRHQPKVTLTFTQCLFS